MDRSLLVELDILCDGRRAFVNCTRDTLIKGLVTPLPSTSTVVEVLESVPADPDVVAACRSLKAGHMPALDDYLANNPREPLADIADIIKVEMQLTTEEQQQSLIKRFGPWRCRMLTEKIETRAEFLPPRSGIRLFPGIFLPSSRNDEDSGHAGASDELPAYAAGRIALRPEPGGTGNAGRG